MNIDPIVLLAYVSVSINVITMIAACIAYAIFHVRKHRRKKTGSAILDQPAGLLTPVFLRPYSMAGAFAARPADEAATTVMMETHTPALAGVP